MPRLFLDSFLATMGGMGLWGFPKRIASFTVSADRYTVTSSAGQRIMSLQWDTPAGEDYRPIREFPEFEPIRQMLNQPLISMVPYSVGPFFVLSDFDKIWEFATLRPLHTSLEVDLEFVPGFQAGRYPQADFSRGIDSSVLGSYELRTPWRLSLPYPPLFSFKDAKQVGVGR
jgi:hypothetical protein